MRVTVDEDACIASGQCVRNAPNVFDQRDEDGVVRLLAPVPPEAAATDVRRAAASCPALAITIEDTDG